ncbi:MAG: hypothetical protein IIX44_10325 [Clostridia bacterium]|nr:hypothetical protein [Clostridia bacterium]
MPAFMAATEYVPKNQKIMEKETKITVPDGCEIKKVEIVDGVAVVTFKEKERELPKSFEEFCELFPKTKGEFYINANSSILKDVSEDERSKTTDANLLPDCATAEAVLALCQLIQLRNAYNGDWIPNWKDQYEQKYTIEIEKCTLLEFQCQTYCSTILYFKSEELRDEFLRCFRPLIEKLKPLYGIKEGGEE